MSVTTPSTAEVPLRTATAFLVAATIARGFGATEAAREREWRGSLREAPWKEEVREREDEDEELENGGNAT